MFVTEQKQDQNYLKLFAEAQRLLKRTDKLFTVIANGAGIEEYKLTFVNTGRHTNVSEKDLLRLTAYLKKILQVKRPRENLSAEPELYTIKMDMMEIIEKEYAKHFPMLHLFCKHLGVSISYSTYIKNRQTNKTPLRILNRFYKALRYEDYPVPQKFKASLA